MFGCLLSREEASAHAYSRDNIGTSRLRGVDLQSRAESEEALHVYVAGVVTNNVSGYLH